MSILEKMSHAQNRKDDVPNQALAAELAQTKNRDDIKEIARNLWHSDKKIQSDCLKVLYEIGYITPDLIADYVADFIQLLESKNNRLIWGAMIALAIITPLKHQEIDRFYENIKSCMAKGSVITVDNGIAVLANLAAHHSSYRGEIFDYLIDHLAQCRPKEVPQHAEKIIVAVTAENRPRFINTINKRFSVMNKSQTNRLKKVLRQAESI